MIKTKELPTRKEILDKIQEAQFRYQRELDRLLSYEPTSNSQGDVDRQAFEPDSDTTSKSESYLAVSHIDSV